MTILLHDVDRLVFASPLAWPGALSPRVFDTLLAGVILLGGWLAAALLARGLGALLRRALPDGADAPHSPARLVEWTVHWLGLALALLAAADRMGVPLGHSVSERLATVLPRILAAGMLFAAGTVAALLSGALSRRFFESAGVRSAHVFARLVTGVLVGFAVLLAIEQLGFAAQFVMGLGWIAAACAGLAFALAFGLGARDVARDFLLEYLRGLEDEPTPERPRKSERGDQNET